MNRFFWFLVAAFLLATTYDASAQQWRIRRYELDFSLSGVSMYGDIGRSDNLLANMFNGFRPSVGISPSYLLTPNLAVGVDLGYLMFGGQDKEGESHVRVYTLSGHAFQHTVRLEYSLIGRVKTRGGYIYNRKGMVNSFNKVQVYLFVGAGGILSTATIKDAEGSEITYDPGYFPGIQYAACFPAGGGLKLSVDPQWSVGFELGYQFTFSDLVDGYSSSWSDYNDYYFLFNLKAIYRIRNNRNGRPVFNKYYR